MQVLSVSKDASLLKSRDQILRTLGLQVTSVLGFADAIRECESSGFDLFLLGHTVPLEEKRALIAQFQLHCAAPIIEMYRPNTSPTGLANYEFDSTRKPEELATMVAKILRLELPQAIKARDATGSVKHQGPQRNP